VKRGSAGSEMRTGTISVVECEVVVIVVRSWILQSGGGIKGVVSDMVGCGLHGVPLSQYNAENNKTTSGSLVPVSSYLLFIILGGCATGLERHLFPVLP
jgi:hypothetical protein